jgi:aminoglycoside phosphotransferase (APT) family kinase protein
MSREHRIIAAMGRPAFPSRPPSACATDLSVNGAPFYVMGFVDGVIARDEAMSKARSTNRPAPGRPGPDRHPRPDPLGRPGLGRASATSAARRATSPGSCGAGTGTTRPRNQDTGAATCRHRRQIHDQLAAHIPEQGPASVVHGDYRLDNCILHPGRLERGLAVLDWELCTLGDPLADVGQLLVYWPEPGERSALGHSPPSPPVFRPGRS